LFKGTDRQLEQLLQLLNSINPHVKFTMEKEINNSINYLDVTISRVNNRLEFKIYRKETFTDTIIPSCSNHPTNIKLSVFHSLIDRLLKIPLSPANFEKELHVIKTIAKNNGYTLDVINKILFKKTYKQNLNHFYAVNENKIEYCYKKLNYIGHISEKLSNICKKEKILAGFYNKKTIKKVLVNNKIIDRKKLEASGIYQIHCNDCNYIYIYIYWTNRSKFFNPI